MRHTQGVSNVPGRALISATLAALATYAVLLTIVLALVLREGSGLACADAGCGPVARWTSQASPWLMIGAIGVSGAVAGTMWLLRTR